jgi:uncharacterized membrane protein
MDKKTAVLRGSIFTVIGFILLIYGIVSYTGLQERLDYVRSYIGMVPSRYDQELFTYALIGAIGVVLLIVGIVSFTLYGREKK